MLNLTSQGTAHTCDGVSRRDFSQMGTLEAVGLTLADMARLQAAGNVDKQHDDKAVIRIRNPG